MATQDRAKSKRARQKVIALAAELKAADVRGERWSWGEMDNWLNRWRAAVNNAKHYKMPKSFKREMDRWDTEVDAMIERVEQQ